MFTNEVARNLGDPAIPHKGGRRNQSLNKARQTEEVQGVGLRHSTDEAANHRGWEGRERKEQSYRETLPVRRGR